MKKLKNTVIAVGLIQRAMTNLMRNRTSFVIAYRLSTKRDADLIFVMNHGAIIEQGKTPRAFGSGRVLCRSVQ